MNDKKSMKDYLVDLLTPDQKTKFASAFKFEVAPAVVAPVNPDVPAAPAAELKTKDGTVIKYSTPTPVAGVTLVTVVTPDGELPAPVGEIEMENGDMLTIAEGGLLSEIETADAAATEPAETPMAVTKEAMDEAVNSVKSQLDTANKTIAALVSRFDSQAKEVTELKTAIVSFSAAFNELMGTPMAAPIETPSNTTFTKKDKLIAKFAK